MAMQQCPICRMQQSDENQNCQACNAPMGETPPPENDDENGDEETEEETETETEEE